MTRFIQKGLYSYHHDWRPADRQADMLRCSSSSKVSSLLVCKKCIEDSRPPMLGLDHHCLRLKGNRSRMTFLPDSTSSVTNPTWSLSLSKRTADDYSNDYSPRAHSTCRVEALSVPIPSIVTLIKGLAPTSTLPFLLQPSQFSGKASTLIARELHRPLFQVPYYILAGHLLSTARSSLLHYRTKLLYNDESPFRLSMTMYCRLRGIGATWGPAMSLPTLLRNLLSIQRAFLRRCRPPMATGKALTRSHYLSTTIR